jgi:hypothetical protein
MILVGLSISDASHSLSVGFIRRVLKKPSATVEKNLTFSSGQKDPYLFDKILVRTPFQRII